MAELVGSLEKIMTLGMEIKTAVETVQQNKEECHEIEQRMLIVRGIMSHLKESTNERIAKKMEIPKNPVMDTALEDLDKTLCRALELVTDCHKKNRFCLFCTAGDLCKKLCRVQDDISRKIMSLQFAITIDVTFLIVGLKPQDACPPPPQPQQDAGEEKIAYDDNATGHASGGGSEKEETKVDTGFDVPSVALSGFKQFSINELKEATNGFSSDLLIGSGAFARIYKGELHDGRTVAVKRWDSVPDSEQGAIQLINELKFLAQLEHKNIIKYLGYCIKSFTEMDGRTYREQMLVLEHLPNGGLNGITEGIRHVDWSLCFRIIQGIAQGLRYLHEQGILHLDLKPSNILLNSNMDPVITDFGSSEAVSRNGTCASQIMGTLGYMAPEVMLEGWLSTKGDVFSFGVILHRIIGPWSGPKKWNQMLIEAGGELTGLLHPTVRADESQLKDIKMCIEVGQLCTDMDPANRPTMEDVVQMLSGEKELPTPKKSSSNPKACMSCMGAFGNLHEPRPSSADAVVR